jgi:hypothetical protein
MLAICQDCVTEISQYVRQYLIAQRMSFEEARKSPVRRKSANCKKTAVRSQRKLFLSDCNPDEREPPPVDRKSLPTTLAFFRALYLSPMNAEQSCVPPRILCHLLALPERACGVAAERSGEPVTSR